MMSEENVQKIIHGIRENGYYIESFVTTGPYHIEGANVRFNGDREISFDLTEKYNMELKRNINGGNMLAGRAKVRLEMFQGLMSFNCSPDLALGSI
jgi:hypothetical protein